MAAGSPAGPGAYHSSTLQALSFTHPLLLPKDESRIKATVMDVKPVDYREHARRLIMNIRKNAVM